VLTITNIARSLKSIKIKVGATCRRETGPHGSDGVSRGLTCARRTTHNKCIGGRSTRVGPRVLLLYNTGTAFDGRTRLTRRTNCVGKGAQSQRGRVENRDSFGSGRRDRAKMRAIQRITGQLPFGIRRRTPTTQGPILIHTHRHRQSRRHCRRRQGNKQQSNEKHLGKIDVMTPCLNVGLTQFFLLAQIVLRPLEKKIVPRPHFLN
jgi:hypothetical protein